jgi:nicotinate-nucleotide adenylyltransferase
MATIGLLFGSFNPIHTGHLIISEYFATQGGCDLVELIVSPQNPLKKSRDLAPEHHRLAMARLAIRGNPLIKVNDIEFALPRPSYTYHTLVELSARHSDHNYKLIIGSDNFIDFKKWRHWESILAEYKLLCYRRPDYTATEIEKHPNVRMLDHVPMIHISATYIRHCIGRGRSIRYLVPEPVRKYIERENVYGFIR